jgi:hypothetical protein
MTNDRTRTDPDKERKAMDIIAKYDGQTDGAGDGWLTVKIQITASPIYHRERAFEADLRSAGLTVHREPLPSGDNSVNVNRYRVFLS